MRLERELNRINFFLSTSMSFVTLVLLRPLIIFGNALCSLSSDTPWDASLMVMKIAWPGIRIPGPGDTTLAKVVKNPLTHLY